MYNMEKIRFTVMILGLLLAFPLWFYAEMKQADKVLKNDHQNQVDSSIVKKAVIYTEEADTTGSEVAIMPFSKHIVAGN